MGDMADNNAENKPVKELSKKPDDLDMYSQRNWLESMRNQQSAEQQPVEINLSDFASEAREGLRSYNRKYKVTGGQWFMFFAMLFAFWSATSQSNGFDGGVFIVWLVILSVVSAPFRVAAWTKRRLNSRPCPVCGVRVPAGETSCASCGTDFRQH
ncbi:MAG: hypothetical protein RL410_862 [Actinomycetota bacterium]